MSSARRGGALAALRGRPKRVQRGECEELPDEIGALAIHTIQPTQDKHVNRTRGGDHRGGRTAEIVAVWATRRLQQGPPAVPEHPHVREYGALRVDATYTYSSIE